VALFRVHGRARNKRANFSLVLKSKAKVGVGAAGGSSPAADVRHVAITLEFAEHCSMTCQDLARRIQRLQPDAAARDVARLCLLLVNTCDDVDKLDNDSLLTKAWREAGLRLQAATDQHAAMTEELESLARSDPREFTPDQIWVLIRAIKVQGQILQLYLGEPVFDA